MKSAHHSDVMADILDAQAVLVGSPTHNNGMLPLMADMLRYMQGLRPQGKIGAAFGSYGWSGEAVGHLCEALKGMKIDVVDSLRVKNVPTAEDIHACRELGRKLAAAVHERQKTHATLSS
jgi:flavorubredoxin